MAAPSKEILPTATATPSKEIATPSKEIATPSKEISPPPLDAPGVNKVDISNIPSVERFQIFPLEEFQIDIKTGWPKFAEWIEELKKINAYTQTKTDPKEINKVIGITGDSKFDWSSLFPDDPKKKEFAEELLSDIDKFVVELCSLFEGNSAKKTELRLCRWFRWFRVAGVAAPVAGIAVLMLPALLAFPPALLALPPALLALPPALLALPMGVPVPPVASGAPRLSRPAQVVPCIDNQNSIAAVFDYLEKVLGNFGDGRFFLGQFSLVDIACITFVEIFQIFLPEEMKIGITPDWPKLAVWIEELNKIDAYTQTKTDPKELVEFYKNRFLAQQ